MSDSGEIEISVVVSGRNDNWNRTFNAVAPFVLSHNAAVLSQQVERFEQIFVEWAPLEDRPLLSERLVELGPQVRCFVVPRAIHDGFRPGVAFLQYHARNLGIRRALGRRIVAANADILLTPEIVRASLDLPQGACLRAPRYDVDLTVIDVTDADTVLRFCENPRNRIAEHEIVQRHGDQVLPWFENAAGDFACMHLEDWHRCGGLHERVDASMGVDAELIGQARRLNIDLRACEHPIYHVDHPEQQTGRMHMPPFSETGYDNPKDWGLGGAVFDECIPQVYQCSAELAGTFERVGWPPPIKWPKEFDGLTQLHDRAITHKYDAVVFCGLSDAMVGFSLYLDLAPGKSRVWDDGTKETSVWRRELEWEEWPNLRPELSDRPTTLWDQPSSRSGRVLYVTMAGSPAHATLIERGALHMRNMLVVEPGILTTFSPLLAALATCPADWNTLVLLGYGRHGGLIAERLREYPTHAESVAVWDDAPAARSVARDHGLKIIAPDQIVGAKGRQFIVITSAPKTGGTVLAGRLTDIGLVEGRDWIACPFARRPHPSEPRPLGSRQALTPADQG